MLRRNVASQVITFCLVNATTGAALTGATVTTKVALDGTQSAGSGTVTELGTGQYKYVPTQGETNGTSVGFGFTATNAVPVNIHCFTAAFDPTDATALGLSRLDAAITSRMATYTQPTGFLAATFPAGTVANTTNITAGTVTTATNVTTVNGLAAGVITAAAAAADFGEEIADFVWDEVLTGAAHNVASSAGKRLRQLTNAASAFDGTLAGTPTTTVCQLDATASTTTDFYKPGLLVVESSFGIQFRRIDSYNGATREVTVASAFTTTPVFGDVATIIPWASVRVSEFDAGVITAAAIATDAIDADALAADATAEIADKLLGRSIAGAADGGRTVKDALKANRNKVAISAGTMTVYEADDVTPAWTAAVTTAAGNPIDSIDPA